MAMAVKQKVFKLEIAVNNVALVQIRHGQGDLRNVELRKVRF